MKLTEIRINLCPGSHNAPHASASRPAPSGQRLRAFCSLTFDNTFVIRDVKLIDGNGGLFLAMPSRKLCDHCPTCGEKNHLRARFCNACGRRLDEERYTRQSHERGAGAGGAGSRVKLHADIAHPINASCRRQVEDQVLQAYWREVERSRQPGYIPPSLDGEDYEQCDAVSLSQPRTAAPPNSYIPYRAAFQ